MAGFPSGFRPFVFPGLLEMASGWADVCGYSPVIHRLFMTESARVAVMTTADAHGTAEQPATAEALNNGPPWSEPFRKMREVRWLMSPNVQMRPLRNV